MPFANVHGLHRSPASAAGKLVKHNVHVGVFQVEPLREILAIQQLDRAKDGWNAAAFHD
jgi:hypothetical protein